MTDETAGCDRVNCFQVEGNTLIFREADSDNFLYVKIAEGNTFSETRS